jgi:hypothetical protein
MAAVKVDIHPETEADRIAAWRLEELRRAGYAPRAAAKLAAAAEVDLHQAVDLLRQGCDAKLALRILL